MNYDVQSFSAADDPERLRRCQRLRYEIYFEELGMDPPDMDHERRLDLQKNDPYCDFITVERGDGRLVGCLRLQPPGEPYYAEDEFVLASSWWDRQRMVEGARFAIVKDLRHGIVPLLLFREFRRYCRSHDIGLLLSVIIAPDPEMNPQIPLSTLSWLRDSSEFDLEKAHPREDYVFAPFEGLDVEDFQEVPPADPATLPPMMRMIGGPRSTLMSVPAYCRKFDTWNFLFVTDLRPPQSAGSSQ